MQYKPAVARLSTIHSSTLAPGTHDVSCHLPSNPSSPFSSKQGSCTRWVMSSSSQLSCLPSSLSSPLSTCLVLGVCYVIKPLDLFPSSVQHCCPLNNANLHQSATLVAASYKARKRCLHEYLHLQIHSKISYSYIIMCPKVDKMLSH